MLYHTDPTFSDTRKVWANSVDLDLSSLIKVYTDCHSVYIFWIHYWMVKQQFLNFKTITFFQASKVFGLLRQIQCVIVHTL